MSCAETFDVSLKGLKILEPHSRVVAHRLQKGLGPLIHWLEGFTEATGWSTPNQATLDRLVGRLTARRILLSLPAHQSGRAATPWIEDGARGSSIDNLPAPLVP